MARTIKQQSTEEESFLRKNRGWLLAAAALAAAAVYNTRQARRTEQEEPPMGKFVEVAGMRLHYLESGRDRGGPPVVLLHGNMVSAEDFRLSGIHDMIADDHRVIAFDRPGFGYSDRPRETIWSPRMQAALFRRAFEKMGLRTPVVVGHSWGAMVAMALALEHPQSVSGLVLLGGYFYPTLRADVPLLSAPLVPVVGDVMRYTLSPLIGRATMPSMVKAMFAPRPVPMRFTQGFPTSLCFRPWQIRAAAEDSATMIPWVAEMQHRYHELRIPVTIMAGDQDKIVDVNRHSMRLHQDIPHSELNVLPDAGHMLHYADPQRIAHAIHTVARALSGRPAEEEEFLYAVGEERRNYAETRPYS
ncbi:alpha/beta fold hydrolase [Telmatospirillum sp. J64-1]|uniref:alpha/beta fold hydrolase n=1 Tax=Telmatospirillum sp. J64-1 TaxID=2502183 RepID=UPI00115CC632|nr:alpha/beta hydrolase [Telmatospirillum sp. J64-1]